MKSRGGNGRLTASQHHSAFSIDKMKDGTPLDDIDRWDWLIQLREAALSCLNDPKTNATTRKVVVSCSALKKKYRDVFRIASYWMLVKVTFLHLQAREEVMLERARTRKGHLMKESMVRGQLEDLEEPGGKEKDVVVLNGEGTLMDMVEALSENLGGAMDMGLERH